MKCPRLTVRKLRCFVPVLPDCIGDHEIVLLFRTNEFGKVVESQLFTNSRTSMRTTVPGFTHYARLPFYL